MKINDMQSDLNPIDQYMSANRFLVYVSKSKHIIFATVQKHINVHQEIYLNDQIIERVHTLDIWDLT